MSTGLLERVEEIVVQAEVKPGEDLDHVVCHCDLDKGWCGAATETIGPAGGDLNGKDCPTCEALVLKYDEVCPYGCSCTASERYWYCGIDDLWDDEDEEDEEDED